MKTRPDEIIVDVAWGLNGLRALLPASEVVVIVDVLSFSTAVDIAVGRGAQILPYPYGEETAESYAESQGAVLARPRQTGGGQLSLSPKSLQSVTAGARIVLPSPNGSMLSRETGSLPTLAGCLRNASAVARQALSCGRSIAVIAAGERWPDDSLRPAIEDLLGAGAIVDRLGGQPSPDAAAVCAGYHALRGRLGEVIRSSQSGQELIHAGFAGDVEVAVGEDVSGSAPLLQDSAYRDASLSADAEQADA